jgi:hypothetical protein
MTLDGAGDWSPIPVPWRKWHRAGAFNNLPPAPRVQVEGAGDTPEECACCHISKTLRCNIAARAEGVAKLLHVACDSIDLDFHHSRGLDARHLPAHAADQSQQSRHKAARSRGKRPPPMALLCLETADAGWSRWRDANRGLTDLPEGSAGLLVSTYSAGCPLIQPINCCNFEDETGRNIRTCWAQRHRASETV